MLRCGHRYREDSTVVYIETPQIFMTVIIVITYNTILVL